MGEVWLRAFSSGIDRFRS